MEKKDQGTPMSTEERRAFLRKAGTATLSVPAAAVLLSVTKKRAHATGYGDSDGKTYKYDDDD